MLAAFSSPSARVAKKSGAADWLARRRCQIPVFNEIEDGLLGIALDPGFDTNNWCTSTFHLLVPRRATLARSQ